jgi:hypothetical protein
VAWRFAISELLLVAGAMALAIAAAGWSWLVPFAAAAPLFAVELWFDIRSRGRYLVPELCGAIGITAAAAAIVIAGGEPLGLAVAVWAVLGARALASVPFVRAQVVRLRGNAAPASTDGFQVAAALTAVAATIFDHRVVLGAATVVLLAAVQAAGLRRPVPPIKVLGLRQMAFGLAVVGATAFGTLVLS